MLKIDSTIELNDGAQMPLFGYGSYRIADGGDGVGPTLAAIDAGYIHIDTASAYNNEEDIGKALERSPVPRDQLCVTSKLWLDQQGAKETPPAIDACLKRLRTDYIDLLLIHWPHDEKMAACWDAMQAAVSTGKVRSIGVSNFSVERFNTFDRLCDGATPVINQVEYHCFLQQKPLHAECRKRGIVLSGYCPLARAKKLDDPTLAKISKKHNKTAAQVMLRWALQQGSPTIPKSSDTQRIQQNASLFDFELDRDDLTLMDTLDISFESNHWRPDHETFY